MMRTDSPLLNDKASFGLGGMNDPLELGEARHADFAYDKRASDYTEQVLINSRCVTLSAHFKHVLLKYKIGQLIPKTYVHPLLQACMQDPGPPPNVTIPSDVSQAEARADNRFRVAADGMIAWSQLVMAQPLFPPFNKHFDMLQSSTGLARIRPCLSMHRRRPMAGRAAGPPSNS
jgi:hypothetical protein